MCAVFRILIHYNPKILKVSLFLIAFFGNVRRQMLLNFCQVTKRVTESFLRDIPAFPKYFVVHFFFPYIIKTTSFDSKNYFN